MASRESPSIQVMVDGFDLLLRECIYGGMKEVLGEEVFEIMIYKVGLTEPENNLIEFQRKLRSYFKDGSESLLNVIAGRISEGVGLDPDPDITSLNEVIEKARAAYQKGGRREEAQRWGPG